MFNIWTSTEWEDMLAIAINREEGWSWTTLCALHGTD